MFKLLGHGRTADMKWRESRSCREVASAITGLPFDALSHLRQWSEGLPDDLFGPESELQFTPANRLSSLPMCDAATTLSVKSGGTLPSEEQRTAIIENNIGPIDPQEPAPTPAPHAKYPGFEDRLRRITESIPKALINDKVDVMIDAGVEVNAEVKAQIEAEVEADFGQHMAALDLTDRDLTVLSFFLGCAPSLVAEACKRPSDLWSESGRHVFTTFLGHHIDANDSGFLQALRGGLLDVFCERGYVDDIPRGIAVNPYCFFYQLWDHWTREDAGIVRIPLPSHWREGIVKNAALGRAKVPVEREVSTSH